MAKFSLSNSLKVRNQLEKEQYQEILSLYQNMAKKARSQARKLRGGTQSDKLQASELRKLAKQLQQEAEAIGERLEKEIPDTLLKASQAVVEDLDKFNQKIGLTIEGAYRRVPTDIVEVLVSGKLYGDDWSLSKAIWADIKKTQKDINTVVAEGLALNKSSYDIAKDLEKYVDPTAKKPWDWSKVYPGTKKKVDYNAQRLARTMVGHAYQQSVVATTENNPFIDGILWISGHTRTTCEICEKRNGKVFPADKLPLDHPNGKCSFAPQVDRSMDDIADELADWAKGKSNPGMDKWFKSMYPDSEEREKNTKISGVRAELIEKKYKEFTDNYLTDRELLPSTKGIWDELTSSERSSLYEYTIGSDSINSYLRGKSNKKPSRSIINRARNIQSAIDKSELPFDMRLNRSISDTGIKSLLNVNSIDDINDSILGNVVSDKAFISTSAGKTIWDFSDNHFNLEILAPKGTKGIYAEPFAYYGGGNQRRKPPEELYDLSIRSEKQMEVILQAGTKFRVNGIKKSETISTVVLEVIL